MMLPTIASTSTSDPSGVVLSSGYPRLSSFLSRSFIMVVLVAFWLSGFLRGQRSQEEHQPVTVEYVIDIGRRVAASGQDRIKLLEIGDCFNAGGRLFHAEPAIQIRSNR